jgi:hypothetical protein
VAKVEGIEKRIVYNASKAYVMQLRSAEEDRTRIQACKDAATLDRWVDNVLGAKTASEELS